MARSGAICFQRGHHVPHPPSEGPFGIWADFVVNRKVPVQGDQVNFLLGDPTKRDNSRCKPFCRSVCMRCEAPAAFDFTRGQVHQNGLRHVVEAVSYTHLTLPTIYSV